MFMGGPKENNDYRTKTKVQYLASMKQCIKSDRCCLSSGQHNQVSFKLIPTFGEVSQSADLLTWNEKRRSGSCDRL